MCTGKVGDKLANLSPHRLLKLPSYLDPMLHPDSKYNQPKVIPYKDAKTQAGVSIPSISALIAKKQRNAGGINPTLASGTPDTPVLPVGGG